MKRIVFCGLATVLTLHLHLADASTNASAVQANVPRSSAIPSTNPDNRNRFTTNYVLAPLHFRVVAGQLYDIHKSNLWKTQAVEVIERRGQLTIARTYEMEAEYATHYIPPRRDPNASIGNFMGGSVNPAPQMNPYRRVKVGETKVFGPTIALTNANGLALGQPASVVAMPAGRAQQMALWDCGTPHLVPVLAAPQKARR